MCRSTFCDAGEKSEMSAMSVLAAGAFPDASISFPYRGLSVRDRVCDVACSVDYWQWYRAYMRYNVVGEFGDYREE